MYGYPFLGVNLELYVFFIFFIFLVIDCTVSRLRHMGSLVVPYELFCVGPSSLTGD